MRVKVEDIREGDGVDLETCPYLYGAPSAEFEYATVVEVEEETPDCIFIGYDGLGGAGYPRGTVLEVKRENL